MAQKSPAGNGLSFPYKDLEYEVARRRLTMTTRYAELGGRVGA